MPEGAFAVAPLIDPAIIRGETAIFDLAAQFDANIAKMETRLKAMRGALAPVVSATAAMTRELNKTAPDEIEPEQLLKMARAGSVEIAVLVEGQVTLLDYIQSLHNYVDQLFKAKLRSSAAR
jgi:hypothetical protein